MNRIDPWIQIVGGLRARTVLPVHPSRKPNVQAARERRNPTKSTMANASSIRRIDWQTSCTILVSWSDSTLGRYEDQTWRAGFARKAGICGLTGLPVRRGDAVFQPFRRGGATPANAPDMIRADVLPRAEEIDNQ
jgi:hypothetical protein